MQRVETTPTGIDLVIADHPDRGYNDVVWTLQSKLNDLGVDMSDSPLLQDLMERACIKNTEDDPRNVMTTSRTDERNMSTQIPAMAPPLLVLGHPHPIHQANPAP